MFDNFLRHLILTVALFGTGNVLSAVESSIVEINPYFKKGRDAGIIVQEIVRRVNEPFLDMNYAVFRGLFQEAIGELEKMISNTDMSKSLKDIWEEKSVDGEYIFYIDTDEEKSSLQYLLEDCVKIKKQLIENHSNILQNIFSRRTTVTHFLKNSNENYELFYQGLIVNFNHTLIELQSSVPTELNTEKTDEEKLKDAIFFAQYYSQKYSECLIGAQKKSIDSIVSVFNDLKSEDKFKEIFSSTFVDEENAQKIMREKLEKFYDEESRSVERIRQFFKPWLVALSDDL